MTRRNWPGLVVRQFATNRRSQFIDEHFPARRSSPVVLSAYHPGSRKIAFLPLEVHPRGFEPIADASGHSDILPGPLAESYALSGNSDPVDTGLAAVVNAWPTLLEEVRAQILAFVRR